MTIRKESGWLLIEALIYLLVLCSIEISFMASWAASIPDPITGDTASFAAAVERQLAHARTAAIISQKAEPLCIRKGTKIDGFVMLDDLYIVFNHFGVIEQGGSAGVGIKNAYYRLSVTPVTAEVHLTKIS